MSRPTENPPSDDRQRTKVQSLAILLTLMIKPMQTYHQLLDESPLRFWFAGIFGGFLFLSACAGRFYVQGPGRSVTSAKRWEKIAYLCLSGGMLAWGFWHIFRR
jgi:hypothetical protein